MEVAKEEAEPEPPPAAAPHEGEVIAEAPSLVDAPAPSLVDTPPPPSPETPPLDPGPPEAVKEAEEAAPPFARPTLRAVLAAPFWAGLLGSGAGLWVLGTIGAFGAAEITPRLDMGLIVLGFAAAIIVGMTLGFRAPVRSYADLAGRFFGAFFFGSLWAALALLIVILIDAAERIHDLGVFVAVAVLGALTSGLALLRLYGIGAERPRRIKIAVASAVVLFLICWPAIPAARCRLGSSEGCRAAADSSLEQGDARAAGTLGARGCEGGDRLSCRLAGRAYRSDGPARDLRLSEGFFREGCALGDPPSCESVHAIELELRCDRYAASACAELARAHRRGDGVEQSPESAMRLYRKACLLGADDACEMVNRSR